MSIIKFTRNTLYQIGIPYVLLGSDKLHSTNREKLLVKSDLEPAAQIFLSSPTKINNSDRQAKKHYYTHNLCEYWYIVFGSHRLSNIAFEIPELHCLVTRVLKTLILCALFAWIYLQEPGDYFHEKNNCCVVQVNVKFTVKSLHAGTLVTCWTTAPRKPFLYKRLAQLASILFLFFILTIVTQCYSSTYATKPELELSKPLSNLSPTLNSRIHSSSIILSRIIQAHFVEKEVPHYHHVLLHLIGRRKRELTKHNLNHISEENFIPKTRKRVHVKVKEIGDKSYLNRIRGKSETKTQRSESAERTEISTQRQNGENFSDFVSVTGNFSRVISQKLNQSNFGVGSSDQQIFQEKTAQPMPPAYGHTDNSLDKWRVLSIILSSVALTVTLGLITCILSHYREEAAPEGGGTASDPNNAALTPTSAPMLSVVSAGATAGVGGMERLRGGRVAARDLAAAKERQVRLHALRTDLAVNLPPSITMPDGEDHPYSNSRIQIRDPEQEAEIYQKCIRPPPNRTVLESESPPPYRSSSAGLLGSSSSSSSSTDWSSSGGGGNAPLVVRCHSMSSTTNSTRRPESASSGQKTDFLQRTVKIFTGKKTSPQAPSPAPTLPAVVVPSGSRRRPPEQNPPPSSHRPSKGGV